MKIRLPMLVILAAAAVWASGHAAPMQTGTDPSTGTESGKGPAKKGRETQRRQPTYAQEDDMSIAARHEAETAATIAVVERFNEAFNSHDVDAIMALMTDDCLFVDTNPSPDGTRYHGQNEVRARWVKLFQNSPTAHFEAEDIFASGDRCTVRWMYSKTRDGKPWHLSGVDVFRVRDGRITEKLSYVKG